MSSPPALSVRWPASPDDSQLPEHLTSVGATLCQDYFVSSLSTAVYLPICYGSPHPIYRLSDAMFHFLTPATLYQMSCPTTLHLYRVFYRTRRSWTSRRPAAPLVLELPSLQTTVASALLQLLASTCTLSGALPYHLLLSGVLPYHLLHPLRSITSRSALFPRIWTLSPADVKTQEFGMKKMPPPSSSRW